MRLTISVYFFVRQQTHFESSQFYRVGQIGEIDGFDDTNCNMAPKTSKNRKKSCYSPLRTLKFFRIAKTETFRDTPPL